MTNLPKSLKSSVFAAIMLTAFVAFGLATSAAVAQNTKIDLSGANEVPPTTSAAKGSGVIVVAADKSVTGSITISGVDATAAHIHEAPAGTNGSVIVPLTKTDANTFTVPAGAKLTDGQYASYTAGNLYVNVHSAANPGGEIRGQLNLGSK